MVRAPWTAVRQHLRLPPPPLTRATPSDQLTETAGVYCGDGTSHRGSGEGRARLVEVEADVVRAEIDIGELAHQAQTIQTLLHLSAELL